LKILGDKWECVKECLSKVVEMGVNPFLSIDRHRLLLTYVNVYQKYIHIYLVVCFVVNRIKVTGRPKPETNKGISNGELW